MSDFKKNIVCFGDSNTHGYNNFNKGRFTEEERWTMLLAEHLGNDYLVHEEGLGGRSTCFDDPLGEGRNALKAIHPLLMTHAPVDLLIIMLGTNDVKERFHATPENIAAGLNLVIQKALCTSAAWRDRPNILVMSPPPIEPDYIHACMAGEMGHGCAEKSALLEPLFRQTAADNRCSYLNTCEVPGVGMAPYDHMHMSLAAHAALAQKLAELIPSLF